MRIKESTDMASQFQVQDLVRETAGMKFFRAVDARGNKVAFTELKLDPDVCSRLGAVDVFDQAMARLRALDHEFLNRVVAGDLDRANGVIRVTGPWVEGTPLKEQKVEEREIRSLGRQFHSLLEDLGDYGNSIDFAPDHILTRRTDEGELQALFSIDLGRWFDDWAAGRPPGSGVSAVKEVRKLLEGLTVKQLQLPEKPREENPIPFVEEKSPALTSFEPPRDNRSGVILAWLGIAICLGVIIWATWQGRERLKDNPRKEVPVWKGR